MCYCTRNVHMGSVSALCSAATDMRVLHMQAIARIQGAKELIIHKM